jgi:RNA polymerase sigma-70 factor, ECF subfamily
MGRKHVAYSARPMPESTPIPPPGASLEDLLAHVALGQRDAFESFYRRTTDKVFGICLRVLADRSEAEEVMQEVFTTVWRKASQFDAARASALAWLAMIARNKAIDRRRADPAHGRLTPIDLAAEIEDPKVSPERDAESAKDRDRLDACLKQLDPRARNLIQAAFFDGSTYQELARRVGSPLGSVKTWIRRSLQQLRACLEL